MKTDDGIPASVRDEIQRRLKQAEFDHEMRVLYACESGSRAWGFASPDSDYDVRFLYVRPRDWYLAFDVETKRDVVEYPIVDEIDCGGWDLRKACSLLLRSNGALLEWLGSPITYVRNDSFAGEMLGIAREAVNIKALCFHYSHMARNNFKYVNRAKVRYKKYFCVLRPLFAIQHLLQEGTPPPIPFIDLFETQCPEQYRACVRDLLEKKMEVGEGFEGPPIRSVHEYIVESLNRFGDDFSGKGRPEARNMERAKRKLNDLFRRAVKQ